MKIGVTGSNGFIGKSLVNILKSAGYSVTLFTSNPNVNGVIFLDWEDKKQLESNFKSLDVLIHLSWIGSERNLRYNHEVQQINVRRAESMISIIKYTNIARIIAFGSQDELKDGLQPWSDDSNFFPTSEYGRAKYESYNILSNHFSNFTWARLFSVYGKDDKRDWILMNACTAIKKNIELNFGRCAKPWSLTHVSDVSSAINLIIKNDLSGTINISTLEAPTLKNHLQLLEQLAGKKLFTFLNDAKLEREVSRSIGILETSGWLPRVSRKEGFLELLK